MRFAYRAAWVLVAAMFGFGLWAVNETPPTRTVVARPPVVVVEPVTLTPTTPPTTTPATTPQALRPVAAAVAVPTTPTTLTEFPCAIAIPLKGCILAAG